MARLLKRPVSIVLRANAAANVGRQLGTAARRARESQGLTLTEVATTAGISAGMLSRLETGRVTPSLDTLVALAAALGVRPALLLQQVGEKRRALSGYRRVKDSRWCGAALAEGTPTICWPLSAGHANHSNPFS